MGGILLVWGAQAVIWGAQPRNAPPWRRACLELDGPITWGILDGIAWNFTQAK